MNDHKQIARVRNPFDAQATSQLPSGAMVEVESARAVQEVQAAMTVAKKFPRNSRDAMERIQNACTRPTLAEAALYSYPRGGTEVTGPSIRLAETIAQMWGNIQFGIQELSSHNGVSQVEAYAWDIETNTRQSKTFHVQHTRYSRAGGNETLTDPRDIYEVVANQGARRLRACILGIIPGDVIEAAVKQVEETQRANIEITADTIKTMTDFFEKFGVGQELIEARIGKRLDAINPGQMLHLRKIATSLTDGMSKPGQWFDMANPEVEAGTQVSDLALSPPADKTPAAGAGEDRSQTGRKTRKDKGTKRSNPVKSEPSQEAQNGPESDDSRPASNGTGHTGESAPDSGTGPESGDQGDQGDQGESGASAAGPADDMTYAQMAEMVNACKDDTELDRAETMLDFFLEVDGNAPFKNELVGLVIGQRQRIKTTTISG